MNCKFCKKEIKSEENITKSNSNPVCKDCADLLVCEKCGSDDVYADKKSGRILCCECIVESAINAGNIYTQTVFYSSSGELLGYEHDLGPVADYLGTYLSNMGVSYE